MKGKSINWILGLILLMLVGLILISTSDKPTASAPTVTPTSTVNISKSVSGTMSAIEAATETAAPSSTPTLTPLPPTATPFIVPESFYITDIVGHKQYFGIGCETSAAVDWANYFNVQIYEYNFQHELPLSDNPDLGFVGDANGPWGQVPPYAYGVHAAPVAELLQKYGLNAVGEKNLTLEQLKESLALSKPVIAWVIGNVTGGVPSEYTDSQGNTTIVAAYEHVIILTGYDQDSIRYMNNGRFYEVPTEVFLNSWGVLGNMAVLME